MDTPTYIYRIIIHLKKKLTTVFNIYKKISSIYKQKKIKTFKVYLLCKRFFYFYLMFVFLVLVCIFNTSKKIIRVYL